MKYIRYKILDFYFCVSDNGFPFKSFITVITFRIIAYIVYIFNCITFLLYFLLLTHTICCLNNIFVNKFSQVFLVYIDTVVTNFTC